MSRHAPPRWWAVIDCATGAHQFVTCADPAFAGHDARTHRFVGLDREPGEHDRFDGRRLQHDEASAAAARLTPEDRFAAAIDARLRHHGLLKD